MGKKKGRGKGKQQASKAAPAAAAAKEEPTAFRSPSSPALVKKEPIVHTKEEPAETMETTAETPEQLMGNVEEELCQLAEMESSLRQRAGQLRRDVAKSKKERDDGLERYNDLLKAQPPVNLQAQAALVRARAKAADGSPATSCCIAILVMVVATIIPFFLVPLLIVRQSVDPATGNTASYVVGRLLEPAVSHGS